NIDTNSRLCMASTVAGYKRAFGADVVPCSYQDLEQAKLIVLVGSNTAWCHPVIYQRIAKAKRDNPALKIVVIDPRRTSTCEIADLYLPLQAGADTTLFNGLLVHLEQHGKSNTLFTKLHTEGPSAALLTAAKTASSLEIVADYCGLDQESVKRFYELFARTEQVVTVFSQGVNQSTSGTDKVNSIINCHLLTGRIGKPGMGPFSLTGQPNAMGGREVGGLANQLAAHMELENHQHRNLVQRFWQSPVLASHPGLKAVDLFRAVEEKRIKALWIMATNPVVSLPDTNRVHRALGSCEFVVVSDCMQNTDTSAYAHVRLPALTWGEKDGTVTNSERRISRQRAFLPSPGEARPDWWIIKEMAARMGFGPAFDYDSPNQIFREHASLSGFENQDTRAFDIGALAMLTADEYHNLAPVLWPLPAQGSGNPSQIFTGGRYYTSSGKARFVPVVGRAPACTPDHQYPLVLNTGRVRDHWHTMTRTGNSSRLSAHVAEPNISMHPKDAADAGVQDGHLAAIASKWGKLIARVNITDTQQPGAVFLPMHWNQQFAGHGGVGQLISSATDPISGQPEFKYTPVQVTPYLPTWYGFLLTRRRLKMKDANYWVCAKGEQHWRYELAGKQLPADWSRQARSWLCETDSDVNWIEYFDPASKRYRGARLVEGHLESCIFIGSDCQLPAREWLAQLFNQESLNDKERMSLLTAQAPQGHSDTGPTVCACFNVGRNTILNTIRTHGCNTAEAIGHRLQAGTDCGSCLPELNELLDKSGQSFN
ncbi:MAG: molybdopterin-dependent oxidoreductase, partial [Gammaproteobacteria bacterium]